MVKPIYSHIWAFTATKDDTDTNLDTVLINLAGLAKGYMCCSKSVYNKHSIIPSYNSNW